MTTRKSPPSEKEAGLPPNVPIVLGITGHRAIRAEDELVLRVAVAKIFSDFKERYPHSHLRLLSSLAPGADQLVAEVAEEHEVTVVAPLPFHAEVYGTNSPKSTFEGYPEALAKFEVWMKKVRSFVVPLPDGPDSTDIAGWRKIKDDTEKRHICYANAGGYIARHCHALIVLWDGTISGRPSGTEEIVNYKLSGRRPILDPWHEPLGAGDEIGPVYIIHTPRLGAPGDEPHAGTAGNRIDSEIEVTIRAPRARAAEDRPNELQPGDLRVKVANQDFVITEEEYQWRPTAAGRLRKLFVPLATRMHLESLTADDIKPLRFATWQQVIETGQAINDFNREVIAKQNDLDVIERLRNEEKSPLWKMADNTWLPEDLRALISLREMAAALAGKLDGSSLFLHRALFRILFIGVLCFDFYDHRLLFEKVPILGDCSTLFLWGFPVGVCLCLAISAWVWYTRLNERRLDYRALAETLRVCIYWAVSGIGISVADSYLGQMRGEISWARLATKVSAPQPAVWQEYFQGQTKEHQLDQLCLVETDWVRGQSKFYRESFVKRQKAADWYRLWGFGIASLGVLIALCLGLVNVVCPHWFGHGEHPGLLLVLEITVKVTVLTGALLLLYSERQSNEDLAKQYERMSAAFEKGAANVGVCLRDDAKNIKLVQERIETAQETIEALGREAISEHSRWLILRRNRPFEVPVP
jgi:hypothetical protein